MRPVLLKIFKTFKIFVCLAVSGPSCMMWDLVPCPEIPPRLPALGAWSLSHWTTREVLRAPVWPPLFSLLLPFWTVEPAGIVTLMQAADITNYILGE